MRAAAALLLVLALAGCALQPGIAPRGEAPVRQQSHPRYAPPPGGNAYWDPALGVYVLQGSKLYYRERVYYRWSHGWSWASSPNGPWQPTDSSGVPAGLGRSFSN